MKSLLDPERHSIYLLRHGRTAMDLEHRSDGWLDLPLSDEGRIGIVDAQQYLKDIPLSTIYTPPLKRTHETAHIVQSGTLSKPNIIDSKEAITWNLGILMGVRKSYGRPEVRKLLKNPSVKPLGGESYNEFRDRYLPWFEEVAKEAAYRAQDILIVGSGSNFRCLGDTYFDDPDSLDLDEGGLACLHKTGDSWTMEIIMGDENASHYES